MLLVISTICTQKLVKLKFIKITLNRVDKGFFDRIKKLASRRKFEDLTISPVITWTSKQLSEQIKKLLKI